MEIGAYGSTLKGLLANVTEENMSRGGIDALDTLWEELPEHVAGPAWVAEVVDCARGMSEWIDSDELYLFHDLQEIGYSWADGETGDYYFNLNKRVQDLSLWAISELDDEVMELTGGQRQTLTDLHTLYVYAMARGLWDCVARWVMDQALALKEDGEVTA